MTNNNNNEDKDLAKLGEENYLEETIINELAFHFREMVITYEIWKSKNTKKRKDFKNLYELDSKDSELYYVQARDSFSKIKSKNDNGVRKRRE